MKTKWTTGQHEVHGSIGSRPDLRVKKEQHAHTQMRTNLTQHANEIHFKGTKVTPPNANSIVAQVHQFAAQRPACLPAQNHMSQRQHTHKWKQRGLHWSL